MFQRIEVQFESIERWPTETTKRRQRSKFRTQWTVTCKLLERELSHLGCRRLVVQADCDRSEIRNDGFLRASARLRGPGVVLSFQSKHGPLSYPCDAFDDWQDNVRAIALALEALRTVDRYGVTKRAEQYRGWQALPSPNGNQWTATDAKEFLRVIVGPELFCIFKNDNEQLLRRAEIKTHPDRGGNPDDFKKVQQARRLLLG
ncbi:MAG: hypothetical protein AB7U97_26425 [Pirellulales bacterium]